MCSSSVDVETSIAPVEALIDNPAVLENVPPTVAIEVGDGSTAAEQ